MKIDNCRYLTPHSSLSKKSQNVLNFRCWCYSVYPSLHFEGGCCWAFSENCHTCISKGSCLEGRGKIGLG